MHCLVHQLFVDNLYLLILLLFLLLYLSHHFSVLLFPVPSGSHAAQHRNRHGAHGWPGAIRGTGISADPVL